MGGDVVAVIAVFDERRASAFVLGVGEARNEYATRQRISTVRSGCPAGDLFKIRDRLHVNRLGRLRIHVKDEYLAALESAQPELAAGIGETAMVRLVPSAERVVGNELAIIWRAWVRIHYHQLVR